MNSFRRFVLIMIIAIITAFLISSSFAKSQPKPESDYIDGNLIVQLGAHKSGPVLSAAFQAVEMRPVKLLSRRMNIWLYEFTPSKAAANGIDDRTLLDEVRRSPDVELAQFNHHIALRSTFPNDPSFSNQWGLHNTGQTGGTPDADIDAPETWDITTGGVTALGDTIVIAIVDGGCDLTHPDLPLFKNTNEIPGNGIDDDNNGYIDDYDGWNAYTSTGDVPAHSHGTHVSGIAGAIGNNNTGVSGVNWGAKILPIAGSSTTESVVLEAYGYALEMRALYNETDGAKGAFIVVTNSSFGVDYGNPDDFPLWCAYYDSLGEVGILSATATANINLNVDTQGDVPTACASDYMISVTNTTDTDTKNVSAGYGPTTIDLGAPGTNVYSTILGGGYGYSTGTSMATPHVAGAVAMLYAVACPALIQQYKNDPATVALMMKQFIMDGTDPNSSLNGITVSGGRLNVYNSAVLVQNHPCGTSIDHIPLSDTKDTLNDYEVLATIISDTNLVADSLLLYYRISSVWYEDTLTETANPDEYAGYIPAQSPGTVIDYYLFATDVAGTSDTTDTITFKVTDYDVSLSPSIDADTGFVGDTIWYDLTASNSGLLIDNYTLSLSGNKWVITFFDSTGFSQINSLDVLSPDDTVTFKARVVIPSSQYGDIDTAVIKVTSSNDTNVYALATMFTTSDGTPLTIPVSDNFMSTTIDNGIWAVVSSTQANDVGLNEPSAPYSANLNGDPSGADTLITQAINLRYETNVIVRYSYERTGGGDSPEAGDDLIVEYFDSSGIWQLIQQHPGADPDMTNYEQVTYQLPGNAWHSGLRVRFRCIGTAGLFDDWFIDDVYIGNPPPYEMDMTPDFASQYGPSGDTALYTLTIHNTGLNTDNYTLSNSGSLWDVSFFDSTGVNPISMTGFVSADDSVKFTVKVAIPAVAAMNEADTSLVQAVSINNPSVSDLSRLTTISAGSPGGFPWYEPFPEDTLITLRWLNNTGAVVNMEGLNPPSPPYALNLDGSVDTVITQLIDLSGKTGIMLSYYYQQGGSGDAPSAGEDLWIEYRNDVGTWVEAGHHPGTGSNMSIFKKVNYLLPTDALHGSFQIRIRSFGSCTDCDDWYVDDIRVMYAPDITTEPASFNQTLTKGDSATDNLIITNTGQGDLSYYISSTPVTSKNNRFNELYEAGLVEPASRTYPEGFDDYVDIKGSVDQRQGIPVLRNAGGPDNYGYFWMDSDDSSGPVFDWVDVSATGFDVITDLTDDSYGGPYPIGFDFSYYDTVYNQIYIGSNGIVGFSADSMKSRFKTSIPTSITPNNMLAWLWDDLNPTDGANPGAHVYIDTTGNRCVIQFVDYPEYAAGIGDVVNAEIILNQDGTITFQYLSIAPGFDVNNCTVGIENADGTIGLEVAYLTPYLKDSLAVRFFPPYQWLTLSSQNGLIAPNMADTIAINFTTAELDSGLYQNNIIISSNDPDESTAIIPASLTVEIPQYICGDIDGNTEGPNVADLSYLVAYIFEGGPPPPVMAAANIDGDTEGPNVADLSYLVSFLFQGGPDPVCIG